jgi:hypothetical protein
VGETRLNGACLGTPTSGPFPGRAEIHDLGHAQPQRPLKSVPKSAGKLTADSTRLIQPTRNPTTLNCPAIWT